MLRSRFPWNSWTSESLFANYYCGSYVLIILIKIAQVQCLGNPVSSRIHDSWLKLVKFQTITIFDIYMCSNLQMLTISGEYFATNNPRRSQKIPEADWHRNRYSPSISFRSPLLSLGFWSFMYVYVISKNELRCFWIFFWLGFAKFIHRLPILPV